MTIATTIALPIAVGRNGALTALTQGTPEDIGQSVGLLLDTRPGERAAVPDYGLPDPLAVGLQPDQVVDVVNAWEERALEVEAQDVVARIVQEAAVRSAARVDGVA